jgi:hypothetical protein
MGRGITKNKPPAPFERREGMNCEYCGTKHNPDPFVCIARMGDQIAALIAERDRLREALDTIEGMATDVTYDIQKIAQAALRQTEGGGEHG